MPAGFPAPSNSPRGGEFGYSVRKAYAEASASRSFSFQKSLPLEHGDELVGKRLVVAAGVAHVGEHLRQRFLAVFEHELAVFGQALLGGIQAVDVLGREVAVRVAVHGGIERQAVRLRGLLVGPAHGDGGHGHHEAGQVQHVDDFARVVRGGAQVADAQPLGLGGGGEGLRGQQRVDGGGFNS